MTNGTSSPNAWQRISLGHKILVAFIVLTFVGVVGPWVEVAKLPEGADPPKGLEGMHNGYTMAPGIILIVLAAVTVLILFVTKKQLPKTLVGAILMGLGALIAITNIVTADSDPEAKAALETGLVKIQWGLYLSAVAASLAFLCAIAGHWWGRPNPTGFVSMPGT